MNICILLNTKRRKVVMKSYPVFCNYEGKPTRIGSIQAANYHHASEKAQRLYNRHAYVARKEETVFDPILDTVDPAWAEA
jgi:hypothetical protein